MDHRFAAAKIVRASAVAHLTVDLYLVRLIDNSFYVLVKN
jgi:hypothetical protein